MYRKINLIHKNIYCLFDKYLLNLFGMHCCTYRYSVRCLFFFFFVYKLKKFETKIKGMSEHGFTE